MISRSTNGSSCVRESISVTRTPSAAKMHAYSSPMTPAPTTTSERGSSLDVQQVVAGEDVLAVARRKRIVHRRRPDRDDDHRGADLLDHALRARARRPQAMRIRERGLRGEDVDAVAHQLMAGDVDLVADHVIDAEQQVAHRDVLLDRVRGAVNPALAVAGKPQRRLAQRLARDACRC